MSSILRRVPINEVKSNVIDAVDNVTRGQSQAIIDDVKTKGTQGFLLHSIKLKDLENGKRILFECKL